jgi:DNA (cytosine-5)-methyltransferase 1
MNELHLFAGIGGGILAGEMLGHTPVGAVELAARSRQVLASRQLDGSLPTFPIHDDITTFDGTPFRGTDLVSGGFPCQDISLAGKGEGLDGERSSLWWEMHRVVREVEPGLVFVENTPALLVRGFYRVLGSLADLGFDAEWCVLSAASCGAPYVRKRLWLLAAHPDRADLRLEQQRQARRWLELSASWKAEPTFVGHKRVAADAGGARLPIPEREADSGAQAGRDTEGRAAPQRNWWTTEPGVVPVAAGVPERVGRIEALGNAQVPIVAARAVRMLTDRFLR